VRIAQVLQALHMPYLKRRETLNTPLQAKDWTLRVWKTGPQTHTHRQHKTKHLKHGRMQVD